MRVRQFPVCLLRLPAGCTHSPALDCRNGVCLQGKPLVAVRTDVALAAMHLLDAGLAHCRQSGHRALPAALGRGGYRTFGAARPAGVLPLHHLLDFRGGALRPADPSGDDHPAARLPPGTQPLALCPQPCRAVAGSLCRRGGKRRGADAAHPGLPRPAQQRGRQRRGGQDLPAEGATVEQFHGGALRQRHPAPLLCRDLDRREAGPAGGQPPLCSQLGRGLLPDVVRRAVGAAALLRGADRTGAAEVRHVAGRGHDAVRRLPAVSGRPEQTK